MRPLFFLLLPLLILAACQDSEQADTIIVGPSTFDSEELDALRRREADLANQNLDILARYEAIEDQTKRLRDELEKAKASRFSEATAEFCQ